MVKRIGLIVNPIAGLGGKVGLKGTDGHKTLEKAYALGAKKETPKKVARTLEILKKVQDKFTIVTYPYEMGEKECIDKGIESVVLGKLSEKTTWRDTEKAASDILDYGVDIIVFAGGDGTARNICNKIKNKVPVVGIPTGVKIHSAVFAINAEDAGKLIVDIINDDPLDVKEREVMDIDENALQNDIVKAKLYGYMNVPYKHKYLQNLKTNVDVRDKTFIRGIAKYVIDNMNEDCNYIIGAGTTTREIMKQLCIEYTLIGTDVIKNRKLIIKDANEKDLLEISKNAKTKIIITPIGGQGFIFGRGNQQISSDVIRNVGKDNIIIISTPEKLLSMMGKPLLVDTGDASVDNYLKSTYKVVVGYNNYYAWKCR